jgi:hypothetical protein
MRGVWRATGSYLSADVAKEATLKLRVHTMFISPKDQEQISARLNSAEGENVLGGRIIGSFSHNTPKFCRFTLPRIIKATSTLLAERYDIHQLSIVERNYLRGACVVAATRFLDQFAQREREIGSEKTGSSTKNGRPPCIIDYLELEAAFIWFQEALGIEYYVIQRHHGNDYNRLTAPDGDFKELLRNARRLT